MNENYEGKDNKDNEFLIPQNVSTRTEIFPGIGWKELAIIAVAIGIGFLFFLVLGIPNKYVNKSDEISFFGNGSPMVSSLSTATTKPAQMLGATAPSTNQTKADQPEKVMVPVIAVPFRLCVVILFAGLAYILVSSANGPSILSILISMRRFSNSRKRYYYKSGVY